MAEKPKIATPKPIQSFVEALYLTGMTLILVCFFIFVGFFVYGETYPEYIVLFLISEVIVLWVYVNGNIKLQKYEW